IARSAGHCMTMGTASTMTSAAETLGFTLAGAASIPASDARHGQMASLSGKAIVEMVWHDMKPSDFLTEASFDNAVTAVLALGGSTNAIVHLIALARRAGFALDLDRFDALARQTPLLANLRPSGAFLMEDFYYAGGLRALLWEIRDLLHLDQRTCTGGDLISLDVDARRIDLLISNEEMAARKVAWVAPAAKFSRGYGALYLKHIEQADKGCDFDFLQPDSVSPGEPEIH
ncbi:MAG: hypothetical protein EBW39_12810, partial [Betaproteobacteria bacterium]|nr:hypothetical protein [Betaproteobacteria bacterium]